MKMRYIEIIQEAYDPLKTTHKISSFLYMDGNFIEVPFQKHLKILAKLNGLKVNFDKLPVYERTSLEASLNEYAAQHGIVQGTCTPGDKNRPTSISIKGTLSACKAALRAFAKQYPELPEIETIAYHIFDDKADVVDSGLLRDPREIIRKFGRLY